MNVVLIRPITGNSNQPQYIPPSGLMYLASNLEATGNKVMIIDAALKLLDDEAILNEMEDFNPDLIGIGGIITAYKRVKLLTFKIKERFSVPLVLGGHLASHIPKIILSQMNCDIVVHGYGEKTLCELVKRLENNADISTLKGISYKNDHNKIVFNGFPDRIDFNKLPYPAYHLVEMEKYIPIANEKQVIDIF